MTPVLGVDPGAEGGMAVGWYDDRHGFVMAAAPLPLCGHLVDIHEVRAFVAAQACDLASMLVVVEEQHARPGDGLKGLNYLLPQFGQILGFCNALHISTQTVRPHDWKKGVLAGTAKDKVAAIEHVVLRFPTINLRPGRRRNAHDGMADAVCIAEYGLSLGGQTGLLGVL